MSAAHALTALSAAGVEVRAEGADLRLVGARALGPALRAELPAVAPALHLIASGRWRTDLATWTEARRDLWAEHVAHLAFNGRQPVELAEHVAYLTVSALPPEPAVPPEAPCLECGVFGPSVASGLGSCEACGAVPRFSWPWSATALPPPCRPPPSAA